MIVKKQWGGMIGERDGAQSFSVPLSAERLRGSTSTVPAGPSFSTNPLARESLIAREIPIHFVKRMGIGVNDFVSEPTAMLRPPVRPGKS
jgi:hypothetical protein